PRCSVSSSSMRMAAPTHRASGGRSGRGTTSRSRPWGDALRVPYAPRSQGRPAPPGRLVRHRWPPSPPGAGARTVVNFSAVRIVDSADVADDAVIGDGSSIWHLAQVREGARLGRNCIVGRGAYIGSGVTMGDNCKVQNYALVYEPARLADGVF